MIKISIPIDFVPELLLEIISSFVTGNIKKYIIWMYITQLLVYLKSWFEFYKKKKTNHI